jgi:phosphopantetheinyl transferase
VSLHYTLVPAQPSASLERAWLPLLPPARRGAVLRLRAAEDRNATLLGVALLAQALYARGLALEPRALVYPSRGKPHLRRGPDFSIAHAAGLVGCAVVDAGRVGLDLEPQRAVGAATLRLVLDAVEERRLARGTLRSTDAWVMKEAVVKAAGLGLGAVARVRLARRSARLDGRAWRLRPVSLVTGYVAWLAHDGTRARVTLVAHAAGELKALP